MVLLFLTLLWAPVYFPWFKDSISSQLRAYQVPAAGDFLKGDKLANYSTSMTTGHLDRCSFSRIPNGKIQIQLQKAVCPLSFRKDCSLVALYWKDPPESGRSCFWTTYGSLLVWQIINCSRDTVTIFTLSIKLIRMWPTN